MSHDIHIASPKHLHKNLLTTKSNEASSDLTSGHDSRPYMRLGIHFLLTIVAKVECNCVQLSRLYAMGAPVLQVRCGRGLLSGVLISDTRGRASVSVYDSLQSLITSPACLLSLGSHVGSGVSGCGFTPACRVTVRVFRAAHQRQ